MNILDFKKNEYFGWINIRDFKKMNIFFEWIFWILKKRIIVLNEYSGFKKNEYFFNEYSGFLKKWIFVLNKYSGF